MTQTRNTMQKRLVRSLMDHNLHHPTADEIYEAARQQDEHISRGTVYRILNFLDEAGEIRRIKMPIGPDHYDSRMENHYHFLCRRCNCVVDISIGYQPALNAEIPELPGYRTEYHRLMLVGLCAKCAAQETADTP